MADINATNLTPETLSTLDGTENIVAFDTAEGKKIPLSVLGDYVVQKLTQTLLGQTQSVASAIEQCNSLLGGQIVSSGFNFDTCIDVGNYSIPTASLANSSTGTKPVSAPIGYLKVLRTRDSSNVISQIFYEYSAVAVYYTRNYTVSSQTWTDWVKSPTRAEMDAVTQFKTATITPSTGFESATFTGFSIQQYGRLVVVNGYITNITGLSNTASAEIATISDISLPTVAVRTNAIYAVQAYEAGKNAYFTIGTNGKIQVRLSEAATNEKVLYLSASYLV